ncbi:MAG: helix-turn-helix domain-containing protein [Patescibacteria group bacterium]|nr:helix-turn-helix domain-containing protein [Patescibacteria group bacterium]
MQTVIRSTGLLTATDVARRLNITRTGVYALLARGDVPHFRIGRLVRVREADLDSFLARCRVAPVPRIPQLYGIGEKV